MLCGSWVYLVKVKHIGIGLEDIPALPTWVAQGMLVVGFAFLSVRLFILLWAIITGRAEGFTRSDEARESMEIVEELKKEEGAK